MSDNPKPGTKAFYAKKNRSVHDAMETWKKNLEEVQKQGYKPVGALLSMIVDREGRIAHLGEVTIPDHREYKVSTIAMLYGVVDEIAGGDVGMLLEGMLKAQNIKADNNNIPDFIDRIVKDMPPKEGDGKHEQKH
jgi:hypothetical protein